MGDKTFLVSFANSESDMEEWNAEQLDISLRIRIMNFLSIQPKEDDFGRNPDRTVIILLSTLISKERRLVVKIKKAS